MGGRAVPQDYTKRSQPPCRPLVTSPRPMRREACSRARRHSSDDARSGEISEAEYGRTSVLARRGPVDGAVGRSPAWWEGGTDERTRAAREVSYCGSHGAARGRRCVPHPSVGGRHVGKRI